MLMPLATKIHVARNEPKKKRTENNSPPKRTHTARIVCNAVVCETKTPRAHGTTPMITPTMAPVMRNAIIPDLTTTSHCARFTTGDWMSVNGAANAGTPAVKDGRLNGREKFRCSFSGTGIEVEGDDGA